ncbi:MAG: hypothetical protein OXU44_05740, partial [Gammaproteobacteria bacterium]|nr:hypothetical protein [Gammaproteobacteria bacterium]
MQTATTRHWDDPLAEAGPPPGIRPPVPNNGGGNGAVTLPDDAGGAHGANGNGANGANANDTNGANG